METPLQASADYMGLQLTVMYDLSAQNQENVSSKIMGTNSNVTMQCPSKTSKCA